MGITNKIIVMLSYFEKSFQIVVSVILAAFFISTHLVSNAGTLKKDKSINEEGKSNRFLVGLTVGGGLATSRFNYNSTTSPSILSYRIAPAAGLSIDWHMTRHLAWLLNIMYKEKGNRIDMNQWMKDFYSEDTEPSEGNATAEGYQMTKLSYLEASFLPVIVLVRTIEIGAGGFAGYGIKGTHNYDYTVKYDFPGFPVPDETFRGEQNAEFVLLAPESFDEDQLYINKIDYGICGHLGIRMNPFKLSFGVSYSTRQWEPDSSLSDMFSDNVDHTYNLTGMVTLSWYPGAKK